MKAGFISRLLNKNMKKAIIYIITLTCYTISIAGLFFIYNGRILIGASFAEKTFFYSLFAGVLGSTAYMARGFYYSVAEKNNLERMFDFNRWIWWYLLRPFMGALAGSIAFVIIWLAFDLEKSTSNQLALVLIGFLSGYNFHEFIEKKIVKNLD